MLNNHIKYTFIHKKKLNKKIINKTKILHPFDVIIIHPFVSII